jgi:hypothetical protein
MISTFEEELQYTFSEKNPIFMIFSAVKNARLMSCKAVVIFKPRKYFRSPSPKRTSLLAPFSEAKRQVTRTLQEITKA